MALQRTKSRKLALQILYQNEFHQIPSEAQINSLVGNFFDKEDINSKEELHYSAKILKDLYQHKTTIDELIASYSENWTIERMSLVDLNIMRIAVLEILYHPEIPNKVSINEALELSKIFGSKQSSSFINGILNKVLENHNLKQQNIDKTQKKI